jgi:hypothetical protein
MKLKLVIFFCLFVLILPAINHVPTNGLVLYLPMNGNANDSTSYANNGINHGATPVADRFGRPNKSLYFNGSSYINIPSTPLLNLTKNKSLSSWIFLPSSEVQNWYPTVIHKDEPTMSSTYSIELADYYGYSSINVQHKVDFIYASGSTHYQVFTKQLYTNYQNQWIHIVGTYDSISGYSKVYFNGIISDSLYVGNIASNSSTNDLFIGCGKPYASNYAQTFFKGYLDDIRLYNRPLNKNEVWNLYLEGSYPKSISNDTTTYYVSSESFQSLSPRLQFTKTDSLKAKVGGSDSIINHYAKYVYKANYCTITNSISVTDTLIINVNLSGIIPITNSTNILKIYPNPAKDHINIDFGDYSKMSDYLLVIRNELGKVVYFTSIMQQSASLDIKSWTGSGIYVVQLFDGQSNLVESRKIIIQ